MDDELNVSMFALTFAAFIYILVNYIIQTNCHKNGARHEDSVSQLLKCSSTGEG